jgi:hypothetical protein
MATASPKLPVPGPPRLELPPAMHARFPGLREAVEKHNQAMTDWSQKSLGIVIKGGA